PRSRGIALRPCHTRTRREMGWVAYKPVATRLLPQPLVRPVASGSDCAQARTQCGTRQLDFRRRSRRYHEAAASCGPALSPPRRLSARRTFPPASQGARPSLLEKALTLGGSAHRQRASAPEARAPLHLACPSWRLRAERRLPPPARTGDAPRSRRRP